MKTKPLLKLKSISSLALLLVMVLLSTMACKKDVDEPILPPTPITPPTIEYKDIFENKPLKMFSDYEIANNLDFPGHVINQLGDGLKGGTFGTVVKIGKGLWKFKKWADPNDSTDFEKYMAVINQIDGQITTLQKSVDALGTQLDMDVTAMEELLESGDMNYYITNIQSVMDSSTHNGFGYFMMEGRKFQTGIIDTNQMNIDTAYATAFANNVYNKLAGYDVCGWSQQIHALVCPTIGTTQDNAFRSYANLIIQGTGDVGLQDDEDLMNAYMLFESYFMQIINNQFQCMLVYANACNYIDTTGYQANLYWEGTFQANITEEIEAYLETTEYLALNLQDYRNDKHFDEDLAFMPYGLAPDFHFRDILARSQFMANLIYDGLGLDYPVMCGSVIVPNKYNTAMATPDTSITISVNGSPITPTTNTMASRYPYTYWSPGANAECAPDNIWRSYRFGKVSENVNKSASTEYEISLVDDIPAGNNMEMYSQPWSHIATPSGKVTPLWYNPQNPSETSTTQTDSNFMQFAYFSARWNWGYLFLSMTSKWNKHQEYFSVFQYPSTNTPFWKEVVNSSNKCTYSNSGFIDYGYNAFMGINTLHRVKNGTFLSASDMQVVNAHTSGDYVNAACPPQIWGRSDIQIKLDDYSDLKIEYYVGTSVSSVVEGGPFYGTDDLINVVFMAADQNAESATVIKNLELSTSYSFNTGYDIIWKSPEWGTQDDTDIPIQLIYLNWMQVVYAGNYPLN